MSTLTGTGAQRTAGWGLWILGGLNVAVGLLLVLGGVADAALRVSAVIALVAGAAFVVLGSRVRRGSRSATIAALAALGALGLFQLALLATGPDGQTVFRLATTVVLVVLVVLALRDT